MKNTLKIYILLVFTHNCFSQNQIAFNNFKKNAFYLIAKGTRSKSYLIAKNFNVRDENITHVGIGFLENGEFKIFHVTDVNKNAFKINTINQFVNDQSTYYLGIWESKISKSKFNKLKNICKNYKNKNVIFDYSFQLNNNEFKLYCSEFCENVLKKIGFKFKPYYKKLNPFYKNVLKRDILEYFPVDFFQMNKNFKLVYEKKLKSN